jgi:hypothetical protein
MQSQWNVVMPYEFMMAFLRPAFCMPPPPQPVPPPPPVPPVVTQPVATQPTRYTIEEITPLIKVMAAELYNTTTLEFMSDDDDDDEETNPSVSLEDLRTFTNIRVFQEAGSDKICPVCHEEFKAGEVTRTLRCEHAFHMYCIDRVLENSVNCPMCRLQVFPDLESDDDDMSQEL